MNIQVRMDGPVVARDRLFPKIEAWIQKALARVEQQVTRVEVHLSDLNGVKHGPDDRRCLIEARLAGLGPLAVEHRAPNYELAARGAAEKLERALETTIGKLRER
jgi:hypothetical protein